MCEPFFRISRVTSFFFESFLSAPPLVGLEDLTLVQTTNVKAKEPKGKRKYENIRREEGGEDGSIERKKKVKKSYYLEERKIVKKARA